MYTDNPLADFDAYDIAQAKKLKGLPICSGCNEPIQQEDAVRIGDTDEWYCDSCLEWFRQDIDTESEV